MQGQGCCTKLTVCAECTAFSNKPCARHLRFPPGLLLDGHKHWQFYFLWVTSMLVKCARLRAWGELYLRTPAERVVSRWRWDGAPVRVTACTTSRTCPWSLHILLFLCAIFWLFMTLKFVFKWVWGYLTAKEQDGHHQLPWVGVTLKCCDEHFLLGMYSYSGNC